MVYERLVSDFALSWTDICVLTGCCSTTFRTAGYDSTSVAHPSVVDASVGQGADASKAAPSASPQLMFVPAQFERCGGA